MMNQIRMIISWVGPVVLIIFVSIVVNYMGKCKRVTAPASLPEQEIKAIDRYANLGLDATVTIPQLEYEDMICFRRGYTESDRAFFGFVVALPGDTVAVKGRTLLVNGQKVTVVGDLTFTWDEREAVVCPAHHVYVLTDLNKTDSTAVGPIPSSAMRGQIVSWSE